MTIITLDERISAIVGLKVLQQINKRARDLAAKRNILWVIDPEFLEVILDLMHIAQGVPGLNGKDRKELIIYTLKRAVAETDSGDLEPLDPLLIAGIPHIIDALIFAANSKSLGQARTTLLKYVSKLKRCFTFST